MARRKIFSERQRQMLEFIKKFTFEKGYPPSVRDIGKGIGISSTSVVNYNLNRLAEENFITRDKNVARGIRMTAKNEARKLG